MKKILLAISLLCTLYSYGQTKKIAHRSHSGSLADFDAGGEDDFGLPPGYKKMKQDTTTRKQIMAKDSIPAYKTAAKDSIPAAKKTKKDSIPAKKVSSYKSVKTVGTQQKKSL